MASDKKTNGDNENWLAVDPTSHPADTDAARVDDIPDRLLILANRLQKALDSRRAAVSSTERPQLKKN